MARDESVSASLIHRSDLPPVGIVAVEAVIDGENESIILHCTADGIVAWLNVCPHQGRRLDYVPGKFLIDKGRLVCAAHGATFRLEDGRMRRRAMPRRQPARSAAPHQRDAATSLSGPPDDQNIRLTATSMIAR